MQLVVEAAYHANIIAYTAARFDQTAKEDDNLGHGLFTYAVFEGLEGKGGIAARRQVATKEFADYMKERVGSWRTPGTRRRSRSSSRGATQRPTFWRGDDRGPTGPNADEPTTLKIAV